MTTLTLLMNFMPLEMLCRLVYYQQKSIADSNGAMDVGLTDFPD